MGNTRVTGQQVGDGQLTDADVSAANKDGAAATPSLRTLGTGAAQACAGNDSRLTPAAPNGFAISNGYITATVASNALTIAVKNSAGADPSSSAPVTIQFRDPTSATGALTTLTLTAAVSLVISYGSTMGVTGSGIPFRLWITGFNDGGTFRIGAVLCTQNLAQDYSTSALHDYVLASSTAQGAGALFAQIIYSSVAVTAKPMRVLGFLEWESGISTPGTWAAAPFKIQQLMSGDPLPGETVQIARTSTLACLTGTTATPFDDTIPQNTEGDQYLTCAITPASKCNILEIESDLQASCSATAIVTMAMFRDSNANAICAGTNTFLSTYLLRNRLLRRDLSSTTSSTTYKIRAGPNTGTLTVNGYASARMMGGVYESWIAVKEIMA